MIRTSLVGSMIYETKNFEYIVGGHTMARIKILIFDENSYASQAHIMDSGEEISSGITYSTITEAIQKISILIEEKIKNNEWVKDVARTEANRIGID